MPSIDLRLPASFHATHGTEDTLSRVNFFLLIHAPLKSMICEVNRSPLHSFMRPISVWLHAKSESIRAMPVPASSDIEIVSAVSLHIPTPTSI